MSARGGKEADRRGEHVVALAHEVGNLLAAMRMSVHLLPGASDRERAAAAAELERWVAHAGELLALARPIIGASRAGRTRVSVDEVLAGVGHVLLEPGELAGPLEISAAPRGVPDLRVDLDALHHVLRVLVRTLLATHGEGAITLRAGRRGGRVDFVVESDVAQPGRAVALAITVADAALRTDGGRVTQDSTRRGTRYRVSLPAAEA